MKGSDRTPVLETDVWVDYPQRHGVLRGVKVSIAAGEILGIVGQSGSGKSTLALAILGLLRHHNAKVRGSILLAGREVTQLRERDLRSLRGRAMSLIPQSAAMALNPALRIETQFREAWIAHANDWPGSGLPRVRNLMASLGLPAEEGFLRRFPDQISIGQAQRVLIVMALLHDPQLLIADEPTSALDLLTQREMLDLLMKINAEGGMALLFISHDLLAVSSLCHNVAILHEGEIVEHGRTAKILGNPEHPYTRKLVKSVPIWTIAT
jgi:peptide/nickel transport system ATP-binding protein